MNFYLLHLINTEKENGSVLTGIAWEVIYQQSTEAKGSPLTAAASDCLRYGLIV